MRIIDDFGYVAEVRVGLDGVQELSGCVGDVTEFEEAYSVGGGAGYEDIFSVVIVRDMFRVKIQQFDVNPCADILLEK
jgi:hypothetical protein